MLVIKKMDSARLAALPDTAALEAMLPAGGLAGALADGDTVFVMLLDDRAAGALLLCSEPEGTRPAFLRVKQTAVLPDLRRHGLGRMLMCVAAGHAVDQSVWFLGCTAPAAESDAAAFASALHFRPYDTCAPDTLLLDLSDVEGLRYGK